MKESLEQLNALREALRTALTVLNYSDTSEPKREGWWSYERHMEMEKLLSDYDDHQLYGKQPNDIRVTVFEVDQITETEYFKVRVFLNGRIITVLSPDGLTPKSLRWVMARAGRELGVEYARQTGQPEQLSLLEKTQDTIARIRLNFRVLVYKIKEWIDGDNAQSWEDKQ